jgi:hypothetical protein
MRGAPRDLAILAWANVVAAAAAGWWALFGIVQAVPLGDGAASVLPILIVAVAQVVAGLGLVELRWWARRGLLYCAAWRLALFTASLAVNGMPASWTAPLRSGATGPVDLLFDLWPLLAAALALVTVVYLVRPHVRAQFPRPARAKWIAVDASAVLLAIWLGLMVRYRASPPQVERQAQTAQAPKPIEPGIGAATLVPTYDGAPLDDFAAADLRLTLIPIGMVGVPSTGGGTAWPAIGTSSRPSTGATTASPAIGRPLERRWRVRHGRIRVAAVPAGVYQVQLTIDRKRENGDAGELTAIGGSVALRTGHGPTRVDVPLEYVMQLHAPETAVYPQVRGAGYGACAGGVCAGGGTLVPPAADEIERLPRVPPHVVFRWSPVPRAADYWLTVECGHDSPPRQATVSGLSSEIDLAPCPPPDPWIVRLAARARDGRILGTLGQHAFVVEGTPASRATRGLRPATLTIRPTFDGHALGDVGERDVALVLRAPTASEMEVAKVRWRVRHGRIKIPAFVPRAYHLTFYVGHDAGARTECRPLPGDLVATGYDLVREPLHTDWRPVTRVLALQRTLQLLEPEGADDGVSCSYPAPPHVRSPVTFRWRPVPEAVAYALEVSRPKNMRVAPAVKTTVAEAAWQGTLAPSAPDDVYFLKVIARGRDGRDVALLQLRFVVD